MEVTAIYQSCLKLSEETPGPQMFTLPVTYVYDLLELSNEHIVVTRALLEDFFKPDYDENKRITPMVVKLLWLNYSIVEILREAVDDPAYHLNEETGEEEYLITEQSIYELQNLMLTRHHTNLQLNKLSYSVSLH